MQQKNDNTTITIQTNWEYDKVLEKTFKEAHTTCDMIHFNQNELYENSHGYNYSINYKKTHSIVFDPRLLARLLGCLCW